MAHDKAKAYQNTPVSMQEAHFDVINRLLKLWQNLEDKTSKGKGRVFSYGAMIGRMLYEYQRTDPDIQKLHEILAKYEELNREYELAKKAGVINRRTETPEPNPTA